MCHLEIFCLNKTDVVYMHLFILLLFSENLKNYNKVIILNYKFSTQDLTLILLINNLK